MTKQKASGITWTEETWNPVRGCSRISKGCMNCYAEDIANRFKGKGQPYEGLIASTGQWNGTVKLIHDKLIEPIRWKRPRLIFVNSMSDLFHESLTDDQIDKVFAVMAVASNHTFQVLTKRAKRMHDYFKSGDWEIRTCKEAEKLGHHLPELFFVGGLPNVWLGVSVEDQVTADERIPYLLDTPAAVRWVSAEPLLGMVDLKVIPIPADTVLAGRRIDWLVCGGESGAGARPMHPEWARSLRDQCVAAGVPFHFKQWGEWAPRAGALTGGGTNFAKLDPSCKKWPDVIRLGEHGKGTNICENCGPDAGQDVFVQRVGKKLAGRILDGCTWDEFPGGAA